MQKIKDLINQYNLEPYNSGGGFIHLAQIVNITGIWLINPYIGGDIEDFANELPTDKNQNCLFSFNDWESIDHPNNELSFIAKLSDGLKIMEQLEKQTETNEKGVNNG